MDNQHITLLTLGLGNESNQGQGFRQDFVKRCLKKLLVFFIHCFLETLMTNTPKFLRVCYFIHNVGIHHVRKLVFDVYQTCPEFVYRRKQIP